MSMESGNVITCGYHKEVEGWIRSCVSKWTLGLIVTIMLGVFSAGTVVQIYFSSLQTLAIQELRDDMSGVSDVLYLHLIDAAGYKKDIENIKNTINMGGRR